MTVHDKRSPWERRRIHDKATLDPIKSLLHHTRKPFNPHAWGNKPVIPTIIYTDNGPITVEDAKRQGLTTDEFGYCAIQPFTNGYDAYTYFKPELNDPDTWYRRVTVKCPLCGRKLTARQAYDHDGDRYFALPRHKPKGYNKQPKRKTAHKRLKHYSRTTPK